MVQHKTKTKPKSKVAGRRVHFCPITTKEPGLRAPTSSPVKPLAVKSVRVVVRGTTEHTEPRVLLREIKQRTGGEDVVSVRKAKGKAGARLLVVEVRGKPNLMAMKRLVQRMKKPSPEGVSVKWYEDALLDGDLVSRQN